MPEFDAGIAACLDGAHDFVVGRAAIEAEAGIVVVEAVEDDGAVMVGERHSQLAQVAHSAVGGAERLVGQARHVVGHVGLDLHQRRLDLQVKVVVDQEIQPRAAQPHLAADGLDGAAHRVEGALLQEVLDAVVRRGLVDADPSLGRRIGLVKRERLHREGRLAPLVVALGDQARPTRQVEVADAGHGGAVAAYHLSI